MEIYRIVISSWTASFRYPNFMTAFHPTLEVPPISTVLGLINAAAGYYINHSNIKIGYYFDFQAKEVDVETIYKFNMEKGKPINKVTAEPIKREFLVDTRLSIYVLDREIAALFDNPYYQLLLGRSTDLATVEMISKVDLVPHNKAEMIRGQVIPLMGNFLPGNIQPLPCYFSDSFPRQNIGTQPFSIISAKDKPVSASIDTFRDEVRPGEYVDIYFHNLDFSKFD